MPVPERESDSESTPTVGGGGPRVRPPQEPEIVELPPLERAQWALGLGLACLPKRTNKIATGYIAMAQDRLKEVAAQLTDLRGENTKLLDDALAQQGRADSEAGANVDLQAQLADLRGERDRLLVEVETLRRARAKRIGLMMQLGQILGPDYDGVSLEEVVREFVALRGAGAALHQQWRERGAALCPNRSPQDVATRDLGYMERVERPMGALLFECAGQLEAVLSASRIRPSGE